MLDVTSLSASRRQLSGRYACALDGKWYTIFVYCSLPAYTAYEDGTSRVFPNVSI